MTQAVENADIMNECQTAYHSPPIDLLNKPHRNTRDGTDEITENTRRLDEILASLKIEAQVVNVVRGPSVTRYEVKLGKDVRLKSLISVADDIALHLGAINVRMTPVPGKMFVIGIEVPNRVVTSVLLREIIESNEFCRAKSKLSFAVGKDIGGGCIVGDISKFRHLLIGGNAGSGKSMFMNSIVLSLLYKANPDEVKLILMDPKKVELEPYNGIPHLLIPVVTDPPKALASLQWAVTETKRRCKILQDACARDIDSYNAMVDKQEIEGQKLPHLVIIIDELAGLMSLAPREIEEAIFRVARLGHASGIHLIIATQHSSGDIITRSIRATIPSQIAFVVSSAMESRIILDMWGAEKLAGHGDMLFAPIGSDKPRRMQGCFVSGMELEAVTNYLKTNYHATYDRVVIEDIERRSRTIGQFNNTTVIDAAKEPAAETRFEYESRPATIADVESLVLEQFDDEMLSAAVDVILETGQASVSMLQRKLKLGYTRTALIMDQMEEKGIVGPFQGSKPRAVLITKEQWSVMKNGISARAEFFESEDAVASVTETEN